VARALLAQRERALPRRQLRTRQPQLSGATGTFHRELVCCIRSYAADALAVRTAARHAERGVRACVRVRARALAVAFA
jgi:hypothetical protein